jgi:succinate dehydrogenase/fumarate reductase flavoprotein subunit
MEHPGGLSITAGGGVLFATDRDAAFSCFQAACGGRTPDDVVRAFTNGLYELPAWIEEMHRQANLPLELQYSQSGIEHIPYALPGREGLGNMVVKAIDGFEAFPWARGLRGGARLFKIVWQNVMQRHVPVMYGTSAEELITNEEGAVVGARLRSGDDVLYVQARLGVVLACGGFEWDEELKRQYFQGMPVIPIAGRGNTGDGVRMAQAAGASLWHMWHYHGGYGFRLPGASNAIRHTFHGSRRAPGRQPEYHLLPWIAVDKDGRRFMDEIYPYPNDTNARPMEIFDPDRLEFPRIPCYLVFDEAGRMTGQLGHPIQTADPDGQYVWSTDNSKEVESGLILKAESLSALAGAINAEGHAHIDPTVLETTVEEWNRCAAEGRDAAFMRPAETMRPISKSPFYAIAAWPVVSNTQGGPAHNVNRQVLDPFNRPIAGLYTAGELGSVFGHLYVISSNISECFTSAHQAVRHIANASPPAFYRASPSSNRVEDSV